jgi:hypothetical protein
MDISSGLFLLVHRSELSMGYIKSALPGWMSAFLFGSQKRWSIQRTPHCLRPAVKHVREKHDGFDFLCFGMAFIMKEGNLFNPVNVSLFGVAGVIFNSDGVAHLVREFLGGFPNFMHQGFA